jgi:hypothetical protein
MNINLTRLATAFFVATALSACVNITPSIPSSYTGPRAVVRDTIISEDGSKAKIFALLEIDQRDIQNAKFETQQATRGNGFGLNTRSAMRDVSTQEMKVKITGTHVTAAPILELASRAAGTFFSVEGVVSFKPIADRDYSVVGDLTKEKSCVWIQDNSNETPATEKICAK